MSKPWPQTSRQRLDILLVQSERLRQLQQQFKMSETMFKRTTQSGFSPSRTCAQVLVLCHHCQGDVADKLIAANMPAETPSEYYCHSISIPLLDHLLSEMNSRFGKHQQTALLGLSIVPSILITLPAEDCSSKVKQLAELYENDLPSPECIESEVHSWRIKWQKHLKEHGETSLPSSPILTIRQVSSMFPNINVLVKILCTSNNLLGWEILQWTEVHQDCLQIDNDKHAFIRTNPFTYSPWHRYSYWRVCQTASKENEDGGDLEW